MADYTRRGIIATEESGGGGGDVVVTDLYKDGVINTDFYTDFISTLAYKTTYSFSKQLTYLQIASSSTGGGWIEPYINSKIDLTNYDKIGVKFVANFAVASSGFMNGWLAVSSITPYMDSPWDASVNFFSPDGGTSAGTSAIGDYEGYLDVSSLTGEYYILFNFGRGYSTLNDYIHISHIWLEKDAPNPEPSISYQEVEYIESTGTQYINSDIKPTGNYGFLSSVELTEATSADYALITTQNSGVRWGLSWGAASSDSRGRVQAALQSSVRNSTEDASKLSVGVKTEVRLNNTNQKDCYVGTTQVLSSISSSTSIASYPATIFAFNNAGSIIYYSKLKLYSIKIYSDGSTVVRDFVPCYLTESVTDYWGNPQNAGAIGLWDKVSDKFFPNNGTGKFVKGSDVVPVPDFSTATWAEIQAYIDSNGTAGFADQVGATRSVTLSDDSVHTLRLANVEGNLYELSDGSGYTGMIVEFADIIKNSMYKSVSGSNSGALANISPIGTTQLPNIQNTLPSDLQSVLASVKVVKANGDGDSSLVTSDMSLFIPAEKEVFGSNAINAFSTENEALTWWSYYQSHNTNSGRLKALNGTNARWWLRSPYADNNTNESFVSYDGSLSASTTISTYGVSPCFCLAPQSASRLPSGYTEVEYIESTGTQYIDTGVDASYQMEADLDIAIVNNSRLGIAGVSDFDGTGLTTQLTLASNTHDLYLQFANSDTITGASPFTFTNGQRLSIVHKSGTQSVNGTSVGTQAATLTASATKRYYLCARNVKQYTTYGNIQVYSAQFKQSDTLIRNFVPCIRESDGAVGLYDLCESASPFDGTPFYGNAGSGVFISGDPV